MKKNLALCSIKHSLQKMGLTASILVAGFSANAQLVPPQKLGIMLEGIPFVDMARQERPWGSAANDTLDAKTDAQGWPTEDAKKVFFDWRAPFSWLGDALMEDPDKYNQNVSGAWKLSFDGQADISIVEGAGITFTDKKYDAASNRTSVTVNMIWDRAVQATSICYLKFANTKKTATSATNTGISNVKMIRPGYENSKELIADGFFESVCPFAFMRTMGIQKTNDFPAMGQFFGSDPTFAWSERKQPDFPNQTDKDGMAWEHIIDFANRANKHLWINVPINAESNYMEGLSKLLKARLKTNLKVYFEISNEVWNPGFPQAQFNGASADDEVAKNPNSNLKKAGETQANNSRDWQVRRLMRMTVEMTKALQKEFGSDCVGKTVFPQFAWWTWFEKDQYEKAFQWCQDNYGDPSKLIHGLCISGYAEDNGRASSTLDALLGLQKAAIDKKYNDDWIGHKATADKWKVKLTVYEGSTNFTESFNIKNKILAVRDPRFEDIVKYLVQDTWFNKLKGEDFCFFSLAGAQSSFGTWFIAENDYNPERWNNSPKWKALNKMTGATCTIKGMGPLGTETYMDLDNNISLYPMPSTGMVNLAVRTYTSENVDVKITDISGKVVATFAKVNVASGVYMLDLTSLTNGMYFANINDAGRNISEKIVIAK